MLSIVFENTVIALKSSFWGVQNYIGVAHLPKWVFLLSKWWMRCAYPPYA